MQLIILICTIMKNKNLIYFLLIADIVIALWALYNFLVYVLQSSTINIAIYLIICFILLMNIVFLIRSKNQFNKK